VLRNIDDVPAALPLIALAIGLASGAQLVNSRFAAAGLAAIATLLLLESARRGRRALRWAMIAMAASFGVASACHQANVRNAEADAFAAIDPGRFVVIEAPLDHAWSPHADGYGLRVPRFRVNGIAFARPLAIYTHFAPPPVALHARIRLEGSLRINDRGECVTSIKSPRLIAYDGELSRFNPASWNRILAMRLERIDSPHVALVEAIVLGRGERLDNDLRDNYKRGGTYHLLVFSGLQIALAAALMAMLFRWLHAPRLSDWSLMIFAIAAPLFIGPTPSVSRASIGIGLYALSRIFRRPTSLANLWCVSALIRLLVSPADLIDAAFQLTYGGAGALIFAAKPLARGRRRWLAYVLAAELVVTPLTLFHFHQYALGGSILTTLLTPIVFVMLVVGAIACIVPSASLLAVVGMLDGVCLHVNQVGALGSGCFAAPSMPAMVAGFGGAMFAIGLLRGRRRALAILLCTSLPAAMAVIHDHNMHSVESPRVVALDVGQGDAILLRSGEHNILVDGGPTDAILPLLADRGVRHLDIVLLTHSHPDHCGGLPAVLTRLGADELWISPRRFRDECAQRLLAAAAATESPIHLVRDGDARTLGGLRMVTLVADRTFRHSAENNSSVVTRVQLEGTRVLLTGDLEKEAEMAMADRMLRADVLKVAHHGSRSSSTPMFLDAVRPRIALISCGRHNLFGHPNPGVLESLTERRIRVCRTDRNGSIDLSVNAGRILASVQIDTPR
jgi:competence protein ComEC